MFNLDNDSQTISLVQLKKYDIIEYGNENVSTSTFVVFDKSMDEEIPALLLQLWKFDGGYDHSFVNAMELDFGLNKRVKHYIPKIHKIKIDKIISYRSDQSSLSEKEQFFFDLWASETSEVLSNEFPIPYKINSIIQNEVKEIIIPSWTPLQKIPIYRVKEGSMIEVWSINNTFTVMKVLKL
ncbi:MAG: hypothetical protein ACW99A_02425 [Candidatus Kariarchaeaceae archaeon]